MAGDGAGMHSISLIFLSLSLPELNGEARLSPASLAGGLGNMGVATTIHTMAFDFVHLNFAEQQFTSTVTSRIPLIPLP